MALMDLGRISIDGGTQTRAALNEPAVAEYADALREGVKLPPVVVFFDGSAHWLADGFHRFFAHKAARKASINVDVREGSRRDAVLFSVGANATHGLRRTNEDKRRAVKTMLDDAEWSQWPDREIARQCGVGHPLVAALRNPEVAAKQKAAKSGKVESDSSAPPVDNSAAEAAEGADSSNEEAEKAGPTYTPENYALDEADDAINILSEENDELRARLAVGLMDGTDEEKREAADTIADLRQQVKTLTAENAALKASRNHYQAEASELRKQIKMNERELKKARAAA